MARDLPRPESDVAGDAVGARRGHIRRRAWGEAPLRAKVSVLIVLAAIGGSFVGMAEAHLDHPIWPLVVGLLLLCGLLVRIATDWVWRPIERLLAQLSRMSHEHRAAPIKSLPVSRRDEVGQLARVIHDLSAWAARQHWDATQLRRTFDHRLAKAMRVQSKKIAVIAMRDPLTGLGNRRFLEDALDPVFQACRAAGEELTCLALDMDNFKQVNDSRGHAKGDILLREFANLVRGTIRRGDYAIRLGGDEFLVFLPGCPIHRAQSLADRIISLFAQYAKNEYTNDTGVSVSIGIASLKHDDPATADDLVNKADQALYAAKRAGKNRWAIMPEPVTVQKPAA